MPAATRPAAKAAPVEPAVDFGLDDRLLPLAAVSQIAGIGKTMIYRLMRDGKFPRACKPGGTATRWSEREICAWREAALAARGTGE